MVSVFVDARGGASASDLAARVPQVVSESGTTSYAPAGILVTGASETVTLGVRLSCDWTRRRRLHYHIRACGYKRRLWLVAADRYCTVGDSLQIFSQ